MEEAMSHTGIHQFFFFFSFFSGFFFNTCMGCTASSPLIRPSVLALNLWLHARDKLTHPFPPPPRSHRSSFILLSTVCTSSVCSLFNIIPFQKCKAIPKS